MKKAIGVLMVLVFLSGCTTLKVITFEQHEKTKTKDHKVVVFAIPEKMKIKMVKVAQKKGCPFKCSDDYCRSLCEEWKASSGFRAAVDDLYDKPISEDSQKLIDIGLISLAAAGGKLLFNQIMDEITYKAKGLVEAAKEDYSSTLFLLPNDFKKLKGVIIVRFSKLHKSEGEGNNTNIENHEMETLPNPKELPVIGSLVVLKLIDKMEQGFVISPRYGQVNNSVAITKASDPEINLSVAMAVKTIARQENKLPGLAAIGVGAVSITGFVLDDKTEIYGNVFKDVQSDLIPYPDGISKNITNITTKTVNIKTNMNEKDARIKKTTVTKKIITLPTNVKKIVETIKTTNPQKHTVDNKKISEATTKTIKIKPINNTILVVSIAVTETGNVGFKIDQAVAEQAAIKKALGDGISGSITTLLEPPPEKD